MKPRLLSVAALLLAASPLLAQIDPDRRTGVTFSVGMGGSDIAVRRLLPPNWALLASIGMNEGSAYNPGTPTGPIDLTTWTLSAGARRYFATSDLRPFAELAAGYQWTEDVPGCDDITNPRAAIGGGVEYAIARRVSIEGSAGLGYSATRQRCMSPTGIEYRFEVDSVSTFRTALSVTFYF